MFKYEIWTANGRRHWWAEDVEHAVEQHRDAFDFNDENEFILNVRTVTVNGELVEWDGEGEPPE